MKNLLGAGMAKSGIFISITIFILGTALTAAFFAYEQVAEAMLTLFMTSVGVLLAVLLSRIAANLGAIKGLGRSIDRTVKNSSDPILRDLHRQIMSLTGDRSKAILSASDSDSSSGALNKDLEEIKRLLRQRDDLETQALRQIVAETRLLRMAVKHEDDE